MKYTQVPVSVFEEIQLNAGILVRGFNSSTGAFTEIIGATSGGFTISAVPTFKDLGEGIDNMPLNMMELKEVDHYEVKASGTFVSVTAALMKMLIGAADITGETYVLTSDTAINLTKKYYTRSGTSPNYTYTLVTSPSADSLSSYYEKSASMIKITPKSELEDSDFEDITWIGDYSRKNGETNGGLLAATIKNALNTSGINIKSNDKDKGQFSFEFTGHYSIASPNTVPLEAYIKAGTDEPAA